MKRWAKYLQVLTLAGGFFGFCWEYSAKNSSDERQASFNFTARYYQAPISDARWTLENISLSPLQKRLDSFRVAQLPLKCEPRRFGKRGSSPGNDAVL